MTTYLFGATVNGKQRSVQVEFTDETPPPVTDLAAIADIVTDNDYLYQSFYGVGPGEGSYTDFDESDFAAEWHNLTAEVI